MDKKTVGLIERSGIYNDNITANQIKELPKKIKDTTLIVPYFGSPNYLAGILGSTNYPVVATESESVYTKHAENVLKVLGEKITNKCTFIESKYGDNMIQDQEYFRNAIAISNKPYNEKGQGKNPIWFKLLENLNTPNVLRWQSDVLPTSVLRSTQSGVENARKKMYEDYGFYMVRPVEFGAFKDEGVGAIVDVCLTFCKRGYNGPITVKVDDTNSYQFDFLRYGGKIVTPSNRDLAQFILEQTKKTTYKWNNKAKPSGLGIELADLKQRIRDINSATRNKKDKKGNALAESKIAELVKERESLIETQEKISSDVFSDVKTKVYKYPYVKTFKKGDSIDDSEIVYTKELLDLNANFVRLGIPYYKTGYATGDFSVGAIQVIPAGYQVHGSVFQFPLTGQDALYKGKKHKMYLESDPIRFNLQHWSYTQSNDNTQFDAVPVLDNYDLESNQDIVSWLGGNNDIDKQINSFWKNRNGR